MYWHGPPDLACHKDAGHPITRNFDRPHLADESYRTLTGGLPRKRVPATQVEGQEPRLLFRTAEPGRGRVLVPIPGPSSFDDPLYRVLQPRGTARAAKEPADRFSELVRPGADSAR
jgi:hypothetical protein